MRKNLNVPNSADKPQSLRCLKLYLFSLGVQASRFVLYVIISVILLFIRFFPAVNMMSLKLKMCFTMCLVKSVHLVLLEWV